MEGARPWCLAWGKVFCLQGVGNSALDSIYSQHTDPMRAQPLFQSAATGDKENEKTPMSKPRFLWGEWVWKRVSLCWQPSSALWWPGFFSVVLQTSSSASGWFSPARRGFGCTKTGQRHMSLLQGSETHFHLLLIFTLTCWIAGLRSLTIYALGWDLGYVLQEKGWPRNLFSNHRVFCSFFRTW